MTETLFLLTPFTGPELDELKAIFEGLARIQIARTCNDLECADIDEHATLLSVGSGEIVPKGILKRFKKPAYNLHAASPEFPGRDPHHHAAYRGCDRYGATLHIMTTRVDEGPIVGIETFEVSKTETPETLLARANEAGIALLRPLASGLLDQTPLPALDGVHWGCVKTTRADLIRLSEISPLMCKEEFVRRYHAFNGGTHDNLTLRLHGQTFRIDKKSPLPPRDDTPFSDFTENAYRKLLRQLKATNYRFASFTTDGCDKHVLWRHDVDISMHRALKLAKIEAEEEVSATYFVNPRSDFYNLAEPETLRLVTAIEALGHEIGLHFDAGALGVKFWTIERLEDAVTTERRLIETILKRPVHAMSWHNPDQSNVLDFDDDEIGGLINAYGRRLRRDYEYCSDSNGYWRFDPMSDVIARGFPRLHLLTHPVWWTPEPLSPSDRVDRAILGRARRVRRDYDLLLERAGRIGDAGNIRRPIPDKTDTTLV